MFIQLHNIHRYSLNGFINIFSIMVYLVYIIIILTILHHGTFRCLMILRDCEHLLLIFKYFKILKIIKHEFFFKKLNCI